MSAATDDTDGDRVIEVVSAGALYRGEEWERKYWSCSRVRSLRLTYTTGVFDVDRLPVCLDKTSRIGKRIMKPNQMEHAAKRVHYKDTFPSVASSSESAQGNASEVQLSTTVDKGTNINSSETYLHGGSPCDMAKGGSANGDCSKDECVVKLHGIKDVVEDTFEDVDSWDDDTSKSRVVHHYVSDDACSREPNEHSKDEFEVKLDEMKDVVEDSFEDAYILADNPLKSRAVCHHMSDDACSRQPNQHSKDDSVAKLDEMKDVVEDSFEEDANIWGDGTFKSRTIRYHTSDDACSRLRDEHSKNESAEDTFDQHEHICGDSTSKTRAVCHHMSDDACSRQPNEHLKDESVAKLDEMIDFVEDSFEEDAHIMGDNTSKFRAFGHHVSDDACSIEPNEHPKVLDGIIKGHVETFECQVNVHDGTKTPDVIYDHEKGKYILSESFLAFLEEEFGGDECPYPENYNHCNSMSHTNGMKAGSVSLDLLCNENIDNGLVDVCAQAQCSYGSENNLVSIRREHNVCEQIVLKVEHNVSHHEHHHAFSSRSDHRLELMGCYLHPTPILSIMLNTKNHSNLHICVLCGFLKSFQRFLYIYTITPEDQKHASPRFVGYTPLILPSLEQSSTGNVWPFCILQSRTQQRRVSAATPLPSSAPSRHVSAVRSSRCSPASAGDARLLPSATSRWLLRRAGTSPKTSEDYVIPSLGQLELRRISRKNSVIIGHDGAGGFCLCHGFDELINFLRDISRRTLLATFAAPGNIIFQILPVGFCSFQDMIHAPVNDIEKRLQEVTVSDMCTKVDRDSFQLAQREDIAVWVLVSSVSIAEYQHDPRLKNHNARWRLALLANKRIFMGNILDSRYSDLYSCFPKFLSWVVFFLFSATAVDTSGNYGFAGTYGGLLYMWELSSGRKLAGTQCIDDGRVSCIGVDAESGAVAVADDGCRLLVYTQNSEGTK
ncbi:hypothetical protein PR202_gb27314 [Eleusine coracana subsp. coracana]|uniref:Uncharacterized protein n=1 Tax=Eleusine coracana subsp. coracana TaxID=191504 RepID=A0AAV5FU68_ELECO|nr:hypothetical protein PR202_gb27314 [Eleusine coracana subsp. coracana]